MIIMMIMILPLCISEGDRLDVMILVILNKDSKDCVSTQGGVDQEIALVHDHNDDSVMVLMMIIVMMMMIRIITWVAQSSPCQSTTFLWVVTGRDQGAGESTLT